MTYIVNGVELETDAEGYLLEPSFDDETVNVIAAAENITLRSDQFFARSIP